MTRPTSDATDTATRTIDKRLSKTNGLAGARPIVARISRGADNPPRPVRNATGQAGPQWVARTNISIGNTPAAARRERGPTAVRQTLPLRSKAAAQHR